MCKNTEDASVCGCRKICCNENFSEKGTRKRMYVSHRQKQKVFFPLHLKEMSNLSHVLNAGWGLITLIYLKCFSLCNICSLVVLRWKVLTTLIIITIVFLNMLFIIIHTIIIMFININP